MAGVADFTTVSAANGVAVSVADGGGVAAGPEGAVREVAEVSSTTSLCTSARVTGYMALLVVVDVPGARVVTGRVMMTPRVSGVERGAAKVSATEAMGGVEPPVLGTKKEQAPNWPTTVTMVRLAGLTMAMDEPGAIAVAERPTPGTHPASTHPVGGVIAAGYTMLSVVPTTTLPVTEQTAEPPAEIVTVPLMLPVPQAVQDASAVDAQLQVSPVTELGIGSDTGSQPDSRAGGTGGSSVVRPLAT